MCPAPHMHWTPAQASETLLNQLIIPGAICTILPAMTVQKLQSTHAFDAARPIEGGREHAPGGKPDNMENMTRAPWRSTLSRLASPHAASAQGCPPTAPRRAPPRQAAPLPRPPRWHPSQPTESIKSISILMTAVASNAQLHDSSCSRMCALACSVDHVYKRGQVAQRSGVHKLSQQTRCRESTLSAQHEQGMCMCSPLSPRAVWRQCQ